MAYPDDDKPRPNLEEWIGRLTRAGYDIHNSVLGSTARGSWNGNHPMPSLTLVFDPTEHGEWPKDKAHRRAYRRIRLHAYSPNASSPFTVYAMGLPLRLKTEVEVDYAELADLR